MDDTLLYTTWDAYKDMVPQDPKNFSSSLVKQSCKSLFTFIYETPAKGFGYLVAAIALKYLFYPLSPPFWGLTAGMITGKLVVKILETCHCCCTDLVKRKSLALIRRFPKLQLIGVLFALSIAIVSAPLGFGAGLCVGLIGGLNVSVEHTLLRQRQNAARRKREEAKGPYHLGHFEPVR